MRKNDNVEAEQTRELQQRMTLSLSPSARDILQRTGSPSAYISNIVRSRWSAWQQAMGALLHAEWTPHDIGTAAQVLNGCSDIQVGDTDVASVLVSGIKWGKTGKRKVTDENLRHLLVVASEYWAGNRELRDTLRDARAVHARETGA